MPPPPQLQQLKQEFEQQPRPNLPYPDYYTVPFHAYDEGNLNWQVRRRGMKWFCGFVV